MRKSPPGEGKGHVIWRQRYPTKRLSPRTRLTASLSAISFSATCGTCGRSSIARSFNGFFFFSKMRWEENCKSILCSELKVGLAQMEEFEVEKTSMQCLVASWEMVEIFRWYGGYNWGVVENNDVAGSGKLIGCVLLEFYCLIMELTASS